MSTTAANRKRPPLPTERYVKRYTVELNPVLHANMREVSRRARVQIGVVYENAIRLYLAQPENYMGERKTQKKH